MELIVKLNKGALKFTAVYIVFFVLLSGLAFFADPKGSFVFGQLAVFPGAAFITWTGLINFISADSWLNTGLTAIPLSLVIVYLVGWGLSAIINFKDPSAPIAEDPPDWHKR
jgi:hypothetical protein